MNKSNIDEFNREKWKIPIWTKYTASLIAVVFLAFILGWLLLIPVMVFIFLVYALVNYWKDMKNMIIVAIKPSEAMRAIARRKEELKRDKERALYEELHVEIKK